MENKTPQPQDYIKQIEKTCENTSDCKDPTSATTTLIRFGDEYPQEYKEYCINNKCDDIKRKFNISYNNYKKKKEALAAATNLVNNVAQGGKKRKTKKRKGNDWTRLVTETYKKNKHQKNYTFKKAIKDAKKVYKKVGKTRRKR